MSQKRILLIGKLAISAAWLVAIAGFFLPGDPSVGQTLRLVFFGLVVVHAVECAMFFKALNGTGRPLPGEILRTLAFGVIYYAEIKAELEAQRESTD